MVLQVSLPFMMTPGSAPAPEHTWNRQRQESDQLPAPHSPPPITSPPVTQSFVLINRSRPRIPDSMLPGVPAASPH